MSFATADIVMFDQDASVVTRVISSNNRASVRSKLCTLSQIKGCGNCEKENQLTSRSRTTMQQLKNSFPAVQILVLGLSRSDFRHSHQF